MATKKRRDGRDVSCNSSKPGKPFLLTPHSRTVRTTSRKVIPFGRPLSSCHDILGQRPGFGDGLPVLSHSGNVQTDRPPDQLRSLSERRARRDAARKIGDVRTETSFGLFEKNGVSHFNPACFRILLCVFGSRSMDGCPAMVTRPFFVPCLYCRWLPSCTTRRQPSISTSLIASRIFIPNRPNRGREVPWTSSKPNRPFSVTPHPRMYCVHYQ